MNQTAFIYDYIRTPIGRYGSALASVRADDLAAIPIKALIERNTSVDWSALDQVLMGCANQAGEDNRNVARMALLLAGLPIAVPGMTLNRLCASGMEAVGYAARTIWTGEHHGMDFTIAPNPFLNLIDLARQTKNIRLGTGTIIAPFWHPIRLSVRYIPCSLWASPLLRRPSP